MASIRPRRGTRGTTYRVLWRTPDGAQRSRTLKDAAEARRFAAEMTLAEREGRAPDPATGEVTLAAWAAEVLTGRPLKPKTRATYDELLRARILPGFGGTPLKDIDRASIRRWVAQMSGEVSARRTRNAYALLRHLLAEAVIEGRLSQNPAERIPLPRQADPDITPWTMDELTTVARAAGRYESLVLWLGLMGTRWAETIGLRWEDIREGRVHVYSSLSEVQGRHHRVPTKTYARRVLPVPEGLIAALSAETGELIFTSPQGMPLRSAPFRERQFLPACQRAGVRPIRIHDLRHTCASLLIANGATPKAVQCWLGHSDIRVTMNTYAHAYDTELGAISLGLDGRMRAQGVAGALNRTN